MVFARSAFWHAGDDENAFRHRFWRKTGRVAASIPFAEDLLAAYYCAFDRDTPLPVKMSLIGALAYFVLPVDAIPDMLPVLGFTDDAAVLASTIKLVASHIRPEHRAVARDKLAQFN
ncbi:MAG TPA: YkvA family protein [Pseudolabrys sp.]